MCEPTTLAALALGGTALSAGAGVYGAVQARRQGRLQQQIANQNAAAEQEAALVEEQRFRQQSRAALAQQTLELASQGSRLDEGSPLLLLAQSAENIELDARLIRAGGSARARNSRIQGIAARQRGDAAFAGSLLSAAGQLLTAPVQFRGLTGSFSTAGAGG